MKSLTCLLFLVVLSSCEAQTNLDDMTITYEARTRGSSIEIKATSTQINYKDNNTTKEIKPTAEFWNDVTNTTKEINLSAIESFIPPSDSRTVDAALHATLSIAIDSEIYTSQTFDHGNPPKELKPLVDKLFSILNLE